MFGRLEAEVQLMIDHDVFLEKLNELLKRTPCKREIKKIEKLLGERFSEERLESPIVRFTRDRIYIENNDMEPRYLKNGYISLLNKVQKLYLTEEWSFYNFVDHC